MSLKRSPAATKIYPAHLQSFQIIILPEIWIQHDFRKWLLMEKDDLLPRAAPSTDPPGRRICTAKLPKDTPHRSEVKRCAPGTHR